MHQNLEDGRKVGVQFRLIDSLPTTVVVVSVVLGGAQSNYIKIVGLGDPVWGIARLDF